MGSATVCLGKRNHSPVRHIIWTRSYGQHICSWYAFFVSLLMPPEPIITDFNKTTKRDVTTVQNAIKMVVDGVPSHRRLDVLCSTLSAALPANDLYRSDYL